MAKIKRSYQKIFGSKSADNQVTTFGSIKKGSPVYSKDVDKIQTESFEMGWTDALQDDNAPYRQDRNAVDNVVTSQLAYVLQEGLAEWEANTVYYKGSWVKGFDGKRFSIYESKTDNNKGNILSSENFWEKKSFGGDGVPLGSIVALPYKNFVPEGYVLANGGEYDADKFPDLWRDFIEGGLVMTCTYSQYSQDIAKSGGCIKFGVNGRKFKVPTVGNGTYLMGGNGESVESGLPNITGEAGYFNSLTTHQWAGALYKKAETGTQDSSHGYTTAYLTGLDASLSNPIYGKSDTVQTKALGIPYFVKIANGSINQSMMDWSKWQTDLQSKANINADNFTKEGKSFLSSLGMPSERFDDISLGATNTKYTAPANGYFALEGKFDALDIFNISTGNLGMTSQVRQDKFWRGFTKAKKGQQILLVYGGTPTNVFFRFIYAEGDK